MLIQQRFVVLIFVWFNRGHLQSANDELLQVGEASLKYVASTLMTRRGTERRIVREKILIGVKVKRERAYSCKIIFHLPF